MVKKALCIINPASGKPEPILSLLNTFFQEQKILWEPYIMQKHLEVLPKSDAECIVVYGGDGTVCQVARKATKPLLILHGGTANTMAKKLGIPKEHVKALALLTEGRIQKMDTFLFNDTKCCLRLSAGNVAKAMKKVTREDKNSKGILAYVESFLKKINEPEKDYVLVVDNQKMNIRAGFIAVLNVSTEIIDLLTKKEISVRDGLLDILYTTGATLEHLQGEKISIEASEKTIWGIDDDFETHKRVTVNVQQKKLQVFTP